MSATLTALNTEARKVRTLTAPNGVTVYTRLTFSEAFAVLADNFSPFIAKMRELRASGVALTQNQAIRVYEIAEQTLEMHGAGTVAANLTEEPAAAPAESCKPIAELFQTAKANGAKKPIVRVNINGAELKIKAADDNGKNPGSLYVDNGLSYEDRVYFGRIDESGKFFPSRECNGDIIRALETFAKNPQEAAAAYGKTFGECCFCGRDLSDERDGSSIEVGYGPICAKKYGLPHSQK